MVAMLPSIGRAALLSVGLFAGLPWLRSSHTVPAGTEGTPAASAPTAAAPASRLSVVAKDSPEYRALAIPRSFKSEVDAATRLLVFRDGLCVRDRGIVSAHTTSNGGDPRGLVTEETGITERAVVSDDEKTAVVMSTRYVSRVDLNPGLKSTEGDTIQGATTLTMIDPTHPDGRWQVTLEGSRWVKDLVALPRDGGVVVSTFVPRNGPTDVRLLDPTGHERVRVPDSVAETVRIESAPEGGFVAVELAFQDDAKWERGISVFGASGDTAWTYGWRYGTDAEPSSWTLEPRGVLAVRLASGTRRFDSTGKKR